MPIVLKSGILNLLETSGPVQACNWIALPYIYIYIYIYIYTHTHTHTNTHTHLPFLTTEVISLYTFLKIPIHYGRITDILIIFDTLFSRQPFSTCFYIVPSRLRSICCRGQKCMVLYAQCPKCSQHGPSRYSRKTCLFKYYQFQ